MRDIVKSRVELARLPARRAVYARFNQAGLDAVGTALSWDLVKVLAEYRATSRQSSRAFLTSPPVETVAPIPTADRGTISDATRSAAGSIDVVNDHIGSANEAIQGFNAAMRRGRRAARLQQRAADIRLVAKSAKPTLTFHAIRICAFAVTAALLTKAVSLPFAGLGWPGIVVGSAVAYLIVQFVVTPRLYRRLNPRLQAEVFELVFAIASILASIAVIEVALRAERERELELDER